MKRSAKCREKSSAVPRISNDKHCYHPSVPHPCPDLTGQEERVLTRRQSQRAHDRAGVAFGGEIQPVCSDSTKRELESEYTSVILLKPIRAPHGQSSLKSQGKKACGAAPAGQPPRARRRWRGWEEPRETPSRVAKANQT